MTPLYFDIEGNEHARREWDMHHPFSKGAMNGNERKWADMFKLPMFKIHHNLGKASLHANVVNCPKPDKNLMQLLRFHEYQQDHHINVYDRFIDTMQYIETICETTEHTGLQRNAERVLNNLEQQMPYILLGQVEVRYVD